MAFTTVPPSGPETKTVEPVERGRGLSRGKILTNYISPSEEGRNIKKKESTVLCRLDTGQII